jgi:hypothetical protein
MKHALTKTYAAAAAPRHRLARLARHGFAVCVLACATIGTAQAQYGSRRDDAQLQNPAPARGERMPQFDGPRDRMGEQRFYDQQRDQQRDQRAADEQRRAYQMQQEAPRERRGGRLTPDERRDLRRQINEAGMDIYPNAQRR